MLNTLVLWEKRLALKSRIAEHSLINQLIVVSLECAVWMVVYSLFRLHRSGRPHLAANFFEKLSMNPSYEWSFYQD